MWHSLDEYGNIDYYDVKWPSTGQIEKNIPADYLIEVMSEKHEHAARSREEELLERKKKKKRKMKKRKRKSNKNRWYYGMLGRSYHHDDDFDDFGIDLGGGFGDAGGGE